MQRLNALKVLLLLQLVVALVDFSDAKAVLFENDPCEKPVPGVCTIEKNCPGLAVVMGRLNLRAKNVGHCGFTIYDELICCPIEALPLHIVTMAPPSGIRPRTSAPGHLAGEACRKLELQLEKYAGPQILGGRMARPGEYPHMAALVYGNFNGNNYTIDCGGTLIEKRFVLTAAHCLESKPDKVILGVTDFTSERQLSAIKVYGVKNTTMHNDYRSLQKSNDIGIIELTEDVKFSGEIYPACVHIDPADIGDHTLVNITGFGRNSIRVKKLSKQLLTTAVEIVALDRCNRLIKNEGKSVDTSDSTQLCTLDPRFEKDSCTGDSGGPMTMLLNSEYNKHTVVGVISGGYGCGSSIPSFNTRVANYVDFIESVVWPPA